MSEIKFPPRVFRRFIDGKCVEPDVKHYISYELLPLVTSIQFLSEIEHAALLEAEQRKIERLRGSVELAILAISALSITQKKAGLGLIGEDIVAPRTLETLRLVLEETAPESGL